MKDNNSVLLLERDYPKISLLVIGTGMYVCGRGTQSYGTVMPAIMKLYKLGFIENVLVASCHADSFRIFDSKIKELGENMGISMPYIRYPKDNSYNPTAYLSAIHDLPDPGAVIIVTPDHLHYEMALAAIKEKKHVLVVKPLTPTVAEAHRLIKAAERANVYGVVEFHKRWDWANIKLRDAIKEGIIGSPLYFSVEYSQRKNIPIEFFSSWVNYTSVFQYLGVHYADIIYFVTQDMPKRVVAIGQNSELRKSGFHAYDSIEAVIEWSKGFVSVIMTNWIDPYGSSAMSQQIIKVIGTKGRFESNQTERGVRVITDEGLEEVNPYFCQSYYNADTGYIEYWGYGIESITQFVMDVISIIKGVSSPRDFEGRRPTFRDALVSTAIIEGVRMSLENNSTWIEISDCLDSSEDFF